jgi:hypothetical protein
MFDPENPPDSFKKFKRAIKRTVETAEVANDDEYETALFLVDREGNGDIIHAEQIYENHEGKIGPEEILYIAMPIAIKLYGAKFFGLVLPSTHNLPNGDERDILLVFLAELFNVEVLEAEVDREDDYCELDSWERQDPENFQNIIGPFYRALTLQG